MKKLFIIFTSLFVFATSAFAVDVTLKWTAPDDTRVTGYDVYYGPNNPPTANTVAVEGHDTTEVQITGLVEGNVVYFGAKSHDADGNQSAMSDVIEWTVEPASKTISVPSGPSEIRILFK